MRISLILLAVLGVTQAVAAEPVYGRWSSEACKQPPDIIVSAQRISGAFYCYFTKSTTHGAAVTWQGTCHTPDGNKRGPGEMVGELRDGKLTLDGLGLHAGPLTRCK
jgi:hypothetical protein